MKLFCGKSELFPAKSESPTSSVIFQSPSRPYIGEDVWVFTGQLLDSTIFRGPLNFGCNKMGTNTLNSWMISLSEHIEFLPYKARKQTFSEIVSIVQPGNRASHVSQSSSPDFLIIDSGAFDYISSNKYLFTTTSYSQSLPTISIAHGSQIMAIGIGQASPLPYL